MVWQFYVFHFCASIAITHGSPAANRRLRGTNGRNLGGSVDCNMMGMSDKYTGSRFEIGLTWDGMNWCWAYQTEMNRDYIMQYAKMEDKADWQTGDFEQDPSFSEFLQMYLAQVKIIDDIPKSLSVKDTDGTFTCAAIFHEANDPSYFNMDQGAFTFDYWPTQDHASHTTIGFFNRKEDSDDCFLGPTPEWGLDAENNVALFQSMGELPNEESKPPNAFCFIDSSGAEALNQMNPGDTWTSPDGSCHIKHPSWVYYHNDDSSAKWIQFEGTLSSLATELDQTYTTLAKVQIEQGATLNLPLNTGYAHLDVWGDDCEQFVDHLNLGGGGDWAGDCNWDDSDAGGMLAVDNYNIEWIITGLGILDGQVYSNLRDLRNSKNWFERVFEEVWTCQLCLYSNPDSPQSDWAIQVSGLSIINSPSRGESAMLLNYYGFLPDFGTDTESWHNPAIYKAVSIRDVKKMTWLKESDGFEISADGTRVWNSYLMSADDGLKLAAANMAVYDITAIQANAGGVVSLGSYGLFFNLYDTTVQGLYVHRILQKPSDSDDGFEGIVIGRLCIRDPSIYGNTMRNIIIKDVRVFSYGGDQVHPSGYGNQVYSLFNIGTYGAAEGAWPFCDEGIPFSDDITFTFESEGVQLTNWQVDTDQIRPSGVGEAFSPPGWTKFDSNSIVLENVYIHPSFFSDPHFSYSPTFSSRSIVKMDDDQTAIFNDDWFVGGGDVPV